MGGHIRSCLTKGKGLFQRKPWVNCPCRWNSSHECHLSREDSVFVLQLVDGKGQLLEVIRNLGDHFTLQPNCLHVYISVGFFWNSRNVECAPHTGSQERLGYHLCCHLMYYCMTCVCDISLGKEPTTTWAPWSRSVRTCHGRGLSLWRPWPPLFVSLTLWLQSRMLFVLVSLAVSQWLQLLEGGVTNPLLTALCKYMPLFESGE